MDVIYDQKESKIRWLFRILLIGIATVFVALSFNFIGSVQQNALAADSNTYTDANGNWMGGTSAQHDAWLKTINPSWQSEDYANKIPADAKGQDPDTKNQYIDEWMPDKNLQQLVVYDLKLSSPNDITKELLNNNLTKFDPSADEQNDNQKYFNQVSDMQSLEGIQYASNITFIRATPDQSAAFNTWEVYPHGDLSDISALRTLDKLNMLDIQLDDVYDLSSLVGKKLDSGVDKSTAMSENHIVNASYLGSSKDTLRNSFTFIHQLYELPMVTLNSKVTSFTTPSFVIKNVDGDNVPVKPYYAAGDSNPNYNNFAAEYKSTADGGLYSDPAKQQITWTNLNKNNTVNGGYMTVIWKDSLFDNPSHPYQGYVVQPYQLSDSVGNVNVDFKNGDNNQYIYGQRTLSGNLGDKWNLALSDNNSFNLADTTSSQNQTIQNIIDQLKEQYSFNSIIVSTPVSGEFADTTPIPTVTYTFSTKSQPVNASPVTVKYMDEGNNQIANDQIIKGTVDASYDASISPYKVDTITKDNQTYQLDTTKLPTNVKGKFGIQPIIVTYYYNKKQTPTPPNPPTPVNPINPVNPVTPTPVTPSGTVTTTTEQPSAIAKKGEAVYSLKKIYLYKNKTFKKAERTASYAKKPRINRPMFVVTDYAHSKNGRLRYVVRDVNHHSKTAGKKGLITASWDYVRPVYYRSSHKTLTVISTRGVNEYKNKNLTGKIKNFKQGTQLKVKQFVNHNLTTRYLLSNGHYVTGNRKLVISGKHTQVKKIKVKKTIYRYNNANFSKRTKQIKKGTILKVKKWTYSHEYALNTFGAKRYQIAGGDGTANNKFVKAVK